MKLFWSVLTTGILLDVVTKYCAQVHFTPQCSKINCNVPDISLIGDFLYFSLHYNPGIAFGIKVPPTLLKFGTIALIIGIYYYYRCERKNTGYKEVYLLDLAFSCILAGALGNAYERIMYSQVTDFIGVQYFSIFNIADSLITLGAGILLLFFYKNRSISK